MGLRIAAQLLVDELAVPGDGTQRLGMNVEIVLLRDLEDAQQLHRVVAEHLGRRHGEAIAFQAEAFHLAAAPQGRQAEARAPVVLRLDDGAENAHALSASLGADKVALHYTPHANEAT